VSGLIDRTMIAQAVITIAACIGGWLVFVEPQAVEAQQLEEEIRVGSQHAAGIDQDTVQRLAQQLEQVRSRIRTIEERGEITRDSSYLYSIIMDLARTHHVSVGSLNPGSVTTARGRSRGSSNDGLAVHREISVTASGRYADIAAFVDAVQSLRGYIDVQYLSVAAASGEPNIVNVRLTCRSVRFVLPETLRDMLGRETMETPDEPSEEGPDDA